MELFDLWHHINDALFGGAMTPPRIVIDPLQRQWGGVHPPRRDPHNGVASERYSPVLADPTLNASQVVEDVMLHECLHQFH